MDRVFLSDAFKQAWGQADPFERASQLQGPVYRQVKGRRTVGFELNGLAYFAKIHAGVGWGEIVKDLFQLKWPVLGADQEWRAIRHLQASGVPTMTVAAFGSRGMNPARRESFIITEALPNTVSLDEFTRDWPRRAPPHRLKKALIEQVAAMTRQMHASGMNHRDCYLCHFLLDVSSGAVDGVMPPVRIHLIDLHRAQIRPSTPRRWAVKDLAGLYFSAMDTGLTRADCIRFIRAYEQRPPREALRDSAALWNRVARAARRVYKRHHGTRPPTAF